MNGVMTVSELERVRKQMNIAQGESFHQFVADVNAWYEEVFLYQQIKNHGKAEANMPPNLFRLFEYFSYKGDIVLNHFGEKRYSKEAQEDVVAVLNAYHLFYMHQDDAHPIVRYYNHFGSEVW